MPQFPKPPDLDAQGRPVLTDRPPDLPVDFGLSKATGISAAPDTIDRLASLLPMAGGIAGGWLGGLGGSVFGLGVGGVPGAIGGATIGGAGGRGLETTIKTLRHGLQPQSTSIGGDIKDIGKEGLIQGAYEAGGRALAPVLRPLGRGMMNYAVGASSKLQKQFPQLTETLLKERLPVGRALPFLKSGSEQAAAKRTASAATTSGILDEAGQAGLTINPKPLLATSKQRYLEAAGAPIGQPTRINLKNLMQQYGREHIHQTLPSGQVVPRPFMSPAAAKTMKTVAQREAAPIYRAQEAGQFVPAAAQTRAQFNKDVGTNLKFALEGLPGGFGQRIGASEARTQGLIGAGRALEAAETRPFNQINPYSGLSRLVGAGVLGGGIGAYRGDDPMTMLEEILAARLALGPRSLSRIALGMTHPMTAPGVLRLLGGTARSLANEPSQ